MDATARTRAVLLHPEVSEKFKRARCERLWGVSRSLIKSRPNQRLLPRPPMVRSVRGYMAFEPALSFHSFTSRSRDHRRPRYQKGALLSWFDDRLKATYQTI